MFRIGEFSKLTQVSVRMLRYYDEAGLLRPAQTDGHTNYRLYSTEQIPVLNQIIFLRDLGFRVSEIAQTLNRWEDGLVLQQLENKQREIRQAMKEQQCKLSRIQRAKQDILGGKIAVNYSVSIKSVPSYPVFSLRRIVPDYYAEGLMWKEMHAFAGKHHIALSSNTFSIYHDADYRETDVDIELCAPVAEMGTAMGDFTYRYTEAVPVMACTMVCGVFENIAGAYHAFAGWLQEHSQYRMGQHSRQIVHRGPWNEEDPGKYLIEIQIPLEEADAGEHL